MAQPVLKSIHPVNLLSFGPKTEPIELRSLNILIGANGSGKSNLIEVIRLLHFLPEREPWRTVVLTGGVNEWIWKGSSSEGGLCALSADFSLLNTSRHVGGASEVVRIEIKLAKSEKSFQFISEEIRSLDISGKLSDALFARYLGRSERGELHIRELCSNGCPIKFEVNSDRSILSQLSSPAVGASGMSGSLPEAFELAEWLASFDFHQDWEFGVDCPPRDPQPDGQVFSKLEEDGTNLAQMLLNMKENHPSTFRELETAVQRFYESAKSVKVVDLGTHLQVAIEEEGGFVTPAYRLSDGMLRWLALLCILLNPTPAPVTCIDEPELGLHPDVIPTLADLLRDAATRTQLIVTTHSTGLVEAFSDEPEAICVCDKVEGSTVIERLSEPDLRVWLKKYSLGNLWTRGLIGGKRW